VIDEVRLARASHFRGRYFHRVDWNLRSCGRRGHATYAPNETDLRDALHVSTPVGDAWRCLRCGDFVVGEPRQSGPADGAPTVIRGKMLRDMVILRLLAVERLLRGLLVILAGYGVFKFKNNRNAIQKAFNEDIPLIRPLANKFHWNIEDSSIVHTIRHVLEAQTGTLTWVAIGLIGYGVLQLVEATGLWLVKRWGEYFAVVATSLGLPIEIYELAEKVTWLRVGALVINVAAVVYLLVTKRLFGIRGGHAAYVAERQEANLLEVEVAAVSKKLDSKAVAAQTATHGG
jgi:uncharacterized membrane protein (DUF2068 family)